MTIIINQADLDRDGSRIVTALKSFLTPRSDGRRFQWLYKENPFGLARTWIATHGDEEAVVGVASAFPRRVYAGSTEATGWVLGDFCIASEYRTLGPALQLQRCLLQEVQSEAIPFFYDFPSASMMAVFRRLNISQTGECVRLAKLLRVNRKVMAVVKNPLIGKVLCLTGNMMLRVQAGGSPPQNGYTLSLHEQPCGEEFSALTREIGGRYGVCVERTAQYLNWRYFDNPLERYEIFTARADGRLRGFIVFTQAGEDAQVVDLAGCQEAKLLETLIGGCVDLLRTRGVGTVQASMLSSHPLIGTWERQGFRRREAVPFVAIAAPAHRSHFDPRYGAVWALMHGDRDS